MSTDLNVYMKMLPQFVGKYIFSFLIPEVDTVEFGDYKRTKREYSGYCLKYEVAFCGNRLLENFRGRYLSRIKKANGKHRYYLTTEHNAHICQGCGMDGCRSEYCRGGWEDEKWYSSKYVGKDLENALFKLLNMDYDRREFRGRIERTETLVRECLENETSWQFLKRSRNSLRVGLPEGEVQ